LKCVVSMTLRIRTGATIGFIWGRKRFLAYAGKIF
jgi:hypothetical protein